MAKRLETAQALARDAQQTIAASRARGEELIKRAQRLQQNIAKDFWELGRLLQEMRDQSIHRAFGFERLEDLIDERLSIPRTLAWKLMAVAEHLPRLEAVKLGQEKAYALVAYTKAAPKVGDPAALAKADAKVGGKALSEASVRDLQSAIAAVRAKLPKSLAARKKERLDRELLKTVRERLGAVGVPKAAIVMNAGKVVVNLTRKQAQRLAVPRNDGD